MKPGDDLRAGDLTLRVSLQAPEMNEAGDEIVGWTDIATGVPAAKRGLRGREVLASGRDVNEQWATWTIRFRVGLDTAKRLVWRGEVWEFDGLDNVNGSNRKIELTCRMVR